MDENKRIAKLLLKVVDDVVSEYLDTLVAMAVTGERKRLENPKHPGNFLTPVDTEIDAEYPEKLSRVLPAFVYASEEGAPQIYPRDRDGLPELVVIVDPLDSSELAVRGLHGHTHVVVYSLKEQSPIISIVGDMFHDVRFFYAFRDHNGKHQAFLVRRDGSEFPIQSSQEKELCKALVTAYSLPPRERFLRIAEQRAFLEALAQSDEERQEWGRIGVDFGSIGLCHVAAGFTDAMIEIAKGFTLWDLLPGQHILHAAGGIVTSLEGHALPLNLNLRNLSDVERLMERRQKFVAAGNETLLRSILCHLD